VTRVNNDKFKSSMNAEVYNKVSYLVSRCSLSQLNDNDDVLKVLVNVICQVQAKF